MYPRSCPGNMVHTREERIMKKTMRKAIWAGIILCLAAGCSPAKRPGQAKAPAQEEMETAAAETAVSTDKSLIMTIPEGWEAYEDPDPYDLRLKSSKGYTGVFVYDDGDFDEGTEAGEVLDYQIQDLMSRREEVAVYRDLETETLEGRVITRITYTGTKDLTENIYHFSLVDFESEDKFAVIIQSSLPEEFEENLEELNTMVESAKLTGEPDTV